MQDCKRLLDFSLLRDSPRGAEIRRKIGSSHANRPVGLPGRSIVRQHIGRDH